MGDNMEITPDTVRFVAEYTFDKPDLRRRIEGHLPSTRSVLEEVQQMYASKIEQGDKRFEEMLRQSRREFQELFEDPTVLFNEARTYFLQTRHYLETNRGKRDDPVIQILITQGHLVGHTDA
jgi:hypothetical protein